jgi:ABC-type methionine transport system permease subunit
VTEDTMKNISKMMTKKNLNSVLKGIIAAMPAIPFIMQPKKTPITAYVIGGVSFAIAGGLAALFFFSPKTRTKALTAAKDGYTKVSEKVGEQISHLRPVDGAAHADGDVNGFAGHSDYQPSSL